MVVEFQFQLAGPDAGNFDAKPIHTHTKAHKFHRLQQWVVPSNVTNQLKAAAPTSG